MLKVINKYKVIGIIIILVMTNVYIVTRYNNQKEEAFLIVDHEVEENKVYTEEMSAETIVVEDVPVYICGQVASPGVYYMKPTAILEMCVVQAGGFLTEADRTAVNLARVIIPNEKIYIPKIGEKIDKTDHSYENSNEAPNGQKLININEADKERLKLLPGIGDVKAEQIISYRRTQGPFKTKEGIKQVNGIGEKTYSQIEQMITTE